MFDLGNDAKLPGKLSTEDGKDGEVCERAKNKYFWKLNQLHKNSL